MRESLKEFIKKLDNKKELLVAELGVMEGKNSQIIYDALVHNLKRMYLIDSWSLSYRLVMHDRLLSTVKRFEDNTVVTIIRQQSTQCLELFNDNSLGYLYIDDAHDYGHVLSEMKIWWKKIKAGGMMAGHDVNNSYPERVLQAVIDFCHLNNLTYGSKQNEGEAVGDWWIWKK